VGRFANADRDPGAATIDTAAPATAVYDLVTDITRMGASAVRRDIPRIGSTAHWNRRRPVP